MSGWWKNLKKTVFGEVVKALLSLITGPITPYISGAVLFVLPTVVLWAGKGFAFWKGFHRLPGWLAALATGVILVLLLFLVRQGVRISQLKSAALHAPQGRFTVNCFHCGQLFAVVNPRLHQQPTRVYCAGANPRSSPTAHYVGMGCPVCRQRQNIQFEY